jgi:glycosyltransferase involved in cell wall biosynthesis
LRILFFLHLPIPFPGAAWTRIQFFSSYFRDKGHKVIIAGAFSLKSKDRAGTRSYEDIDILNITPMVFMGNIFSLIFNTISSIITSIIPIILARPDLVIISVPPGETALGAFIAAKLFRRKLVVDYRDEWEDSTIRSSKSYIFRRSYGLLKVLMNQCYLTSNIVVTVTQPLADSLSSRGVTEIKIVSNGADCNVFKPYDKNVSRKKLGIDEDDFILIYSGGIELYYRLDIVLRALQKASRKAPNLKLVLVGVGYDDSLKDLLKIARDEAIDSKVLYLGAKFDKKALAEILSASDTGIVPYDGNPMWKNSLPAKAFEYCACGVPVIATTYKDSILGKLINDNKIGLRCDPENVDSLAEAIEKIYNDHLFIQEASKRATTLIRERFDRNKIAEDFLNILLKKS